MTNNPNDELTPEEFRANVEAFNHLQISVTEGDGDELTPEDFRANVEAFNHLQISVTEGPVLGTSPADSPTSGQAGLHLIELDAQGREIDEAERLERAKEFLAELDEQGRQIDLKVQAQEQVLVNLSDQVAQMANGELVVIELDAQGREVDYAKQLELGAEFLAELNERARQNRLAIERQERRVHDLSAMLDPMVRTANGGTQVQASTVQPVSRPQAAAIVPSSEPSRAGGATKKAAKPRRAKPKRAKAASKKAGGVHLPTTGTGAADSAVIFSVEQTDLSAAGEIFAEPESAADPATAGSGFTAPDSLDFVVPSTAAAMSVTVGDQPEDAVDVPGVVDEPIKAPADSPAQVTSTNLGSNIEELTNLAAPMDSTSLGSDSDDLTNVAKGADPIGLFEPNQPPAGLAGGWQRYRLPSALVVLALIAVIAIVITATSSGRPATPARSSTTQGGATPSAGSNAAGSQAPTGSGTPTAPDFITIPTNEFSFPSFAATQALCQGGTSTLSLTIAIDGIVADTPVQVDLTGSGLPSSITFMASPGTPHEQSFPVSGAGSWSDAIVSIGGRPPPSSIQGGATQTSSVQC